MQLPKIIIALDFPHIDEAYELVSQLAGLPFMVKLGLELFATGRANDLISKLSAEGYGVFADWKLLDIPTTVARATAAIAKSKVTYLTVHANDATMQAAVENAGNTKIIAVTLLTSMSEKDLQQAGINQSTQEFVLNKAKNAMAIGCDGVVCSPLEVSAVRQVIGPDKVIIAPGISSGRDGNDDHARRAGIKETINNGATHVVVGRAIKNATKPRLALEKLLAEI